MIKLPVGAQLYHSYPKVRIITIYAGIGERVATYRFKDTNSFILAERYCFNQLLDTKAPLSKRKREMKIIQFSLEGKLIKTWSYTEIMESIFCYESIKKCNCGNVAHHKGYHWKIEMNE